MRIAARHVPGGLNSAGFLFGAFGGRHRTKQGLPARAGRAGSAAGTLSENSIRHAQKLQLDDADGAAGMDGVHGR